MSSLGLATGHVRHGIRRKRTFSFNKGDLVLVKWTDGMVYFAKITHIYHRREKCTVVFDDKSKDEADFSQIHSVDETTTDIICIKCKRDDSEAPNEIVLCDMCGIGFHQKCHNPIIPASALQLDSPWNCSYCHRGAKCPFLTESLDVLQNLLSDDNESINSEEQVNGMESEGEDLSQNNSSCKSRVLRKIKKHETFQQRNFTNDRRMSLRTSTPTSPKEMPTSPKESNLVIVERKISSSCHGERPGTPNYKEDRSPSEDDDGGVLESLSSSRKRKKYSTLYQKRIKRSSVESHTVSVTQLDSPIFVGGSYDFLSSHHIKEDGKNSCLIVGQQGSKHENKRRLRVSLSLPEDVENRSSLKSPLSCIGSLPLLNALPLTSKTSSAIDSDVLNPDTVECKSAMLSHITAPFVASPLPRLDSDHIITASSRLLTLADVGISERPISTSAANNPTFVSMSKISADQLPEKSIVLDEAICLASISSKTASPVVENVVAEQSSMKTPFTDPCTPATTVDSAKLSSVEQTSDAVNGSVLEEDMDIEPDVCAFDGAITPTSHRSADGDPTTSCANCSESISTCSKKACGTSCAQLLYITTNLDSETRVDVTKTTKPYHSMLVADVDVVEKYGHTQNVINKEDGHTQNVINKEHDYMLNAINREQGHTQPAINRELGHTQPAINRELGHTQPAINRELGHTQPAINRELGHTQPAINRELGHTQPAINRELGHTQPAINKATEKEEKLLLQGSPVSGVPSVTSSLPVKSSGLGCGKEEVTLQRPSKLFIKSPPPVTTAPTPVTTSAHTHSMVELQIRSPNKPRKESGDMKSPDSELTSVYSAKRDGTDKDVTDDLVSDGADKDVTGDLASSHQTSVKITEMLISKAVKLAAKKTAQDDKHTDKLGSTSFYDPDVIIVGVEPSKEVTSRRDSAPCWPNPRKLPPTPLPAELSMGVACGHLTPSTTDAMCGSAVPVAKCVSHQDQVTGTPVVDQRVGLKSPAHAVSAHNLYQAGSWVPLAVHCRSKSNPHTVPNGPPLYYTSVNPDVMTSLASKQNHSANVAATKPFAIVNAAPMSPSDGLPKSGEGGGQQMVRVYNKANGMSQVIPASMLQHYAYMLSPDAAAGSEPVASLPNNMSAAAKKEEYIRRKIRAEDIQSIQKKIGDAFNTFSETMLVSAFNEAWEKFQANAFRYKNNMEEWKKKAALLGVGKESMDGKAQVQVVSTRPIAPKPTTTPVLASPHSMSSSASSPQYIPTSVLHTGSQKLQQQQYILQPLTSNVPYPTLYAIPASNQQPHASATEMTYPSSSATIPALPIQSEQTIVSNNKTPITSKTSPRDIITTKTPPGGIVTTKPPPMLGLTMKHVADHQHTVKLNQVPLPPSCSPLDECYKQWQQQQMLSSTSTTSNKPASLSLKYKNKKPNKICARCGKSATFLCSGCRHEWYCGRDCQLRNWDQHADHCKA